MNLTQLSRHRLMQSAHSWSVPRDYFDPLYNYLVHGFEPGSFWSAVIANDFMRAVGSSHPGNDIQALKNTVGWIRDRWPDASYGDNDRMINWLDLDAARRRSILERTRLIYTEQEEIMRSLRGETSPEPILY